MADRYRPSQGRNQQGYEGDWSRQSEQFESDRSQQGGLNNEWNNRAGKTDRQTGTSGSTRSWQDRDQGGRSSSQSWDPVSDYDRAGSDYRTRRDSQDRDYFRPDDYGGADFSGGQTSIYGGNAMGASNYARSGYSQYRGAEQDRGNHNRDRGFLERAGDEVASWFGDDDAARRREQDHRGRGPGNYTRSDQRIMEDACDRLTDDRGVDASKVDLTVKDGEVTLTGTVADRWQKRRAEDCVDHISGVKHVQNNLRVESQSSGSAETPVAPLI